MEVGGCDTSIQSLANATYLTITINKLLISREIIHILTLTWIKLEIAGRGPLLTNGFCSKLCSQVI